MHIISDRLREIRRKLGITQGELASLVGVSETTVWNWENGRREPRSSEINKLAKVVAFCYHKGHGVRKNKEDIQMEKTKKLNFRITDELHRKLKIIAIKEGRTMNDIICSLIEQYVEQYEEGEDAFK